jgi:hypothetical protein
VYLIQELIERRFSDMISAEQFIREAKKYGIEISMEEAQKALGCVELSDDDLGEVTGGTVYDFIYKVAKEKGLL